MDSGFWYEAGSLVPPIGAGLLFWFAVRAIFRADRHEREAEKEAERILREERRDHSGGDDAAGNSAHS